MGKVARSIGSARAGNERRAVPHQLSVGIRDRVDVSSVRDVVVSMITQVRRAEFRGDKVDRCRGSEFNGDFDGRTRYDRYARGYGCVADVGCNA